MRIKIRQSRRSAPSRFWWIDLALGPRTSRIAQHKRFAAFAVVLGLCLSLVQQLDIAGIPADQEAADPPIAPAAVRYVPRLNDPAQSRAPLPTPHVVSLLVTGGADATAQRLRTGSSGDGSQSLAAESAGSPKAPAPATNSTATAMPTATAASPTATATPVAPASEPIYWGIAMPGVPADTGSLSSWERKVAGKGASIVNWGHDWGKDGGYHPWSNSLVDEARTHGSIPMISWAPEEGDPARWQLRTIIDGAHDEYIRRFATGAKDWGYPFFLRIMHEMNGNWGYPWQEDSNGNRRGEFVKAWRHIVDIFRQVGVTNASYVWCPNKEYPDSSGPTYAALYPGDNYVDWTCLDGYNWGTNRAHGWETFDQVFNYSYREILNVAPSKPLMIGELGSVQQGGSKADWISDALDIQLPDNYPKVRAVVYFDWAIDGVDWRIESASDSAKAWRAGIGSSYYSSNGFGDISAKVPVP
jgi:mannan endo-1,4-beta-mannosidase